ncbi:hypothetical protein LXL04_031526 [Taraxacum kok-saghyz]
MIKAHLILSQTRLIFSRLTDFSSVLTEFNSIWSDFWSDSDPYPTRSTTRVYKKLNTKISHSSQNRPRLGPVSHPGDFRRTLESFSVVFRRAISVVLLLSSSDASLPQLPPPTRPCCDAHRLLRPLPTQTLLSSDASAPTSSFSRRKPFCSDVLFTAPTSSFFVPISGTFLFDIVSGGIKEIQEMRSLQFVMLKTLLIKQGMYRIKKGLIGREGIKKKVVDHLKAGESDEGSRSCPQQISRTPAFASDVEARAGGRSSRIFAGKSLRRRNTAEERLRWLAGRRRRRIPKFAGNRQGERQDPVAADFEKNGKF